MKNCIPQDIIEKIKGLNLHAMDSITRTKKLGEFLGAEQGRVVNGMFEKRLLLKNQNIAFDRFLDDIGGITAEKRAKIKENIAKRLKEKETIIEQKELLTIVQDTLNKKYNLDIPDETVQRLLNLKKEADELAKKAAGTEDGSEANLLWGKKLVEYSDIINDLKDPAGGSLVKTIKSSLEESAMRVKAKEGVLGKTGQIIEEIVKDIFAVPAKGIKAAWDLSMLFRQGMKVFTADPKIWAQQTRGALRVWMRVFNKNLMKDLNTAFKADLVTRDLYQQAIKSKLAVGVVEDFFPTNVAEKIPLIGNLFKASDDSFTMFSQGARMDLFEKYVKRYAKINGVEPPPDVMKSMARYVNALTGRGNLDKAEPVSGWLNQLFFSARYQVANLKTFTDPLLAKTPEVRRIAAKNFAVHFATIGGIMATLAAFTDVGFDPKEGTFGKARIPGSKKWVDVTGGLGSYIALLGKMSAKMGGGELKYGESSALDIMVDFLKGKLAPVPGAARDYLDRRDYSGRVPTALTTLESLFVPISADNVLQSIHQKEDDTITALTALFDIIGAGVSRPKAKPEGKYWSPFE